MFEHNPAVRCTFSLIVSWEEVILDKKVVRVPSSSVRIWSASTTHLIKYFVQMVVEADHSSVV